jgi:polysaccharide biosynthesis/export protein
MISDATASRSDCPLSLPCTHRGLLGAALALAALASVACATPPVMPPPAVQYETYRTGAPDVLDVNILPEPVIQEQTLVRPDGMITVQLIGDVQAGGRTLKEISEDIQGRIGKFKRGARVTVSLVAAKSSSVTVLGEVRSPGTFQLVKETRIAEALGNMGGLTTFAKQGSIRVIRTSTGEPMVFVVNMAAIQAGDMSTNVEVQGGDVIYAPPTLWARFGYAVNAALFPFSPFMRVITSWAGAAIAL